MTSPARPRSVLNNAAWNVFGTLFAIVLTFLLAPLLIHRLGVEQWGLLLLVWSVTGVLGIANFGVGEATLRYVAHYHAAADLNGINRVFGGALTFYIAICAVITGILWVATPTVVGWVKVPSGSEATVGWLLRLSALLFSLGMLANAYRAVPMALHRYDISNMVGSVQTMVRSLGLVVLVLGGLGVVQLVVWEVALAAVGLVVQVVVARRLMPGLRWKPQLSLGGIREILGYSVYTFLTHVFLMMYRESGKLLVGSRLGAASVAYLGTPDNVAYRLHMIVVSGIETLVPRFSAQGDVDTAKPLLISATWAAFACAATLYVPLAVLMPDFLRLWIGAEFARESSLVGQLLTLGLIGPIGFAPMATLFRGVGRPGFVTAVMALAAIIVLAGGIAWVPTLGIVGIGHAYLASTLAWLGGLAIGWVRLYGMATVVELLRAAALPLVLGAISGIAQTWLRALWGEPGWIALFALGALFAGTSAIALVGVDLALGRDSPAGQVVARVLSSRRIVAVRGWFGRRSHR